MNQSNVNEMKTSCRRTQRYVVLELMKNAFLINVVYCMTLDSTTYFPGFVCKQKVINNKILLYQSFIMALL